MPLKGVDMMMMRTPWLRLAAGLACLAAVGCGTPQNNVTDPSDGTSTTDVADGPATDATGDAGSETPAPAPSGPKAPDFTLRTLDGGEITLSELEGKVVTGVLVDRTKPEYASEYEKLIERVQAEEKARIKA